MELFNRLIEKILRIQRRMRRWNRVVLSLTMVVVFVTTYALILPALTLDEEKAEELPGITAEGTEEVTEEDISSETMAADSQTEVGSEEAAASVEEAAALETAAPSEEAAVETAAAETTEAPAEEAQAEAPAAEETAAPAEETAAPAEESAAPAEESAAQTEEPTTEAPAAETTSETEQAPAEETAEASDPAAQEGVATPAAEDVAQVSSLTLNTEGYDVLVSFKNGVTVPANTQLQVRKISKDAPEDAAYQACYVAVYAEYAEMKAGEVRTSLLYEISFTVDGEKFVPAGAMDVRFTYKNNTVSHAEDLVVGATFTGAVPGSTSTEPVKAKLLEKNADGSAMFDMPEGIISVMEMKDIAIAPQGTLVGLFAAAKPISSPAATFEETVGTIKVHVEAPEGAFPEGTTMTVTPVEPEQVLDAVQKAVGDQEEVKTTTALDITFRSAAGEEIQPRTGIKVSFASTENEKLEESKIVHIDEAGEGTVVESTMEDEAAVIEATSFSVYVIVGTETLTGGIITTDGKTYTVTVTYGPDAGIPKDAQLSIKEITESSDGYQNYLKKTEDKLDMNVPYARFFDITIMDGKGKAIEPKEAVDVKITLDDGVVETQGVDFTAVHFVEENTDLINVNIDEAISFKADSFSVYGIAYTYTVDFYYTPEGEISENNIDNSIKYSMQGGTEMLLSQLFAKLGIDDQVENVVSITSEHKEGVVELEERLTFTKQSDADWLISSLEPFEDYYYVTITMKDGTQYVLGVKDPPGDTQSLATDSTRLGHIDIGITAAANIKVPLAYGNYYDEDGNLILTVSLNEFVKAEGTNDLIPIDKSDLEGATITAYKIDSSGNKTNVSFTVNNSSTWTTSTGTDPYTGKSISQVRMDGSYPTGTLSNPVHYSVEVVKDVELTLTYTVNGKTYELYDANGKKLTVTVSASLISSFTYFDAGNMCPPIADSNAPDYPVNNTQGYVNRNVGMDFVLGTSDEQDANISAVEIIKYTVNTDGQIIKVSTEHPATFNFNVYQNTSADKSLPTNWSGATTANINYDGYSLVDGRSLTVDDAGYAVAYDYNVADSALVYIEETSNLENTSIIDTDGNTWDYVETYIETEYAWRGDGGVTHSNINKTGSDRLKAIPDAVGDYGTYTDPDTGTTENLHNTFLEFYVYNVYKGGEVEFKKVDQSGNLLPGATFALYLSDPSEGTGTIEDASSSGAIKAYEATSKENSDGNVEVDFESVAYGTYYMVEVAAPEGYVKDNGVYKVEVYESEGNEYCKVYGFNSSTGEYDTELDKKNDLYVFPNYPEALDVSIFKTTEDGDTALSGAAFSLYGDDYYAADGTTINPDAEVISSVTTGSDGKVSLGSLPSGTYYLVETSAPSGMGYKVLESPVKIIVDATVTTDAVTYESSAVKDVQKVTETVEVDGATTQVTYYLITIKDDPETTEVPVEKIWEDNDNAYNMRPESINVQLKVGDEVKDTQTLNADNEWKYTWENLPAYTYTIEDGVLTNAEAIVYTVEETGDITGYTSATTGEASTGFTITNTIDDYEVGIQKIGDGNENNKLNGATFEIYTDAAHTTKAKDSSGNEIATITTAGTGDNQGKATIGNLLPGTYYLVETHAPDGYNLLSEDVTITIDSRGVTYGTSSTPATVVDGIYTITVSDPSGVELPNTGGPGTLLYTLSGLALMLGAALMYGFRMRRRERRLN